MFWSKIQNLTNEGFRNLFNFEIETEYKVLMSYWVKLFQIKFYVCIEMFSNSKHST